MQIRQGSINQPDDEPTHNEESSDYESDTEPDNVPSVKQLATDLISSESTAELKNTTKIFNRSLQAGKWDQNPISLVQSIAQTCYQLGETDCLVHGPNPKLAEVLRQTERAELLTRLGELAHGGNPDAESTHEEMGEINQRLKDIQIAPNTFAHTELKINYGAASNNGIYGPGSNSRPNSPAPYQRRVSNYTQKPFIQKCPVCGQLMDGIQHRFSNQQCNYADQDGNLCMQKLTELADKDGSAAVKVVNSIAAEGHLARSLQDVLKDQVHRSVQGMISNELLTTINTIKSTTTTRA